MAETPDLLVSDHPVPGRPGIREEMTEMGSEILGSGGSNPGSGIRRVSMRAEIDTSPPFGSVKEAVTHFGGSGSWMPYKQDIEQMDIKKVEEQAAELEKDLIVKELETLDVLEELGTTKKIVEEFKRQLQNEALIRCMTTPNYAHISSPRSYGYNPSSSPDLILIELKQAKLNLGKTMTDLGAIQTSVESLNNKMKKEKLLLEKTCQSLTSKFAGAPSFDGGVNVRTKTAQLRLIAARKMEEAAKAAEAVAIAEIKALSGKDDDKFSGFVLPEPGQKTEQPKNRVVRTWPQRSDTNSMTKVAILKKMKEATEAVKHSKQSLEESLQKVETANRKQFAAEEALRKWIPRYDYDTGFDNFSPPNFHQDLYSTEPVNYGIDSSENRVNDDSKQVLRTTVSMRDVMRKKQVLPEEGPPERRRVALSQMLQELKEDLTFHPKPEKDIGVDINPKQFFGQRRKFGFIHISLPVLARQSRKKMHD